MGLLVPTSMPMTLKNTCTHRWSRVRIFLTSGYAPRITRIRVSGVLTCFMSKVLSKANVLYLLCSVYSVQNREASGWENEWAWNDKFLEPWKASSVYLERRRPDLICLFSSEVLMAHEMWWYCSKIFVLVVWGMLSFPEKIMKEQKLLCSWCIRLCARRTHHVHVSSLWRYCFLSNTVVYVGI